MVNYHSKEGLYVIYKEPFFYKIVLHKKKQECLITMENETKKIIIVTLVAILGLNILAQESKKTFEKSVFEVLKKGPTVANDVPSIPPPSPPPPAQPSEEEQLKQALADKVNVDLGNTPIQGNRNAKIKIIVFSDFQCPFSKRGADTVHALMQKYGDNLMYVYKNLPLPFHPEAMPAAKAALAAGRQGKFYEFHDKLFEKQGEIGEALYVQIAKDLGLNMQKFNADRNSPEIEAQVKADADQASKLGFNGTPGFTVNGVKVLGAYPVEHFEKVISALGVG